MSPMRPLSSHETCKGHRGHAAAYEPRKGAPDEKMMPQACPTKSLLLPINLNKGLTFRANDFRQQIDNDNGRAHPTGQRTGHLVEALLPTAPFQWRWQGPFPPLVY